MNWKTWPMGAAEAERAEIRGRKAFMSHAVDMDTETPICGKVKIHSLMNDSSQWEDNLPDCPVCVRKIQKATATQTKKRDVPQSVFDAFPKRMRDSAFEQSKIDLYSKPRHLLGKGNPNRPDYDDKIFGYDQKEFLGKQYTTLPSK